MAFSLSLAFSLLSEISLSKANIAIAVVVIVIFILISIIFDMIGLAIATCDIEPFTAMASRKVKGSKTALYLIKNADKFSSVFNDVIGDVCGILSGAAGASIIAKLALSGEGFMVVFIASLISSIIAGLTIFGKAFFKKIAIKYCDKITLKVAQVLSIFIKKG